MKNRLYRSRTDRYLFGVCGGLAQYFGIDPTIVRILFIVGAMLGGPGVIFYILLAVLVPEA